MIYASELPAYQLRDHALRRGRLTLAHPSFIINSFQMFQSVPTYLGVAILLLWAVFIYGVRDFYRAFVRPVLRCFEDCCDRRPRPRNNINNYLARRASHTPVRRSPPSALIRPSEEPSPRRSALRDRTSQICNE